MSITSTSADSHLTNSGNPMTNCTGFRHAALAPRPFFLSPKREADRGTGWGPGCVFLTDPAVSGAYEKGP